MHVALARFQLSIFSFGAIMPGGKLAELVLLPQLIDHYQEHLVESNGQLGFFDFLIMHYADMRHEASDPVNHKSMPLHVHVPLASAIADQPAPILEVSSRVVQDHLLITDAPDDDLQQVATASVFHPPKA